MADASDVVVVGGGIGGASLAFALARAGVDVSVLEASTEFADRVRGESMQTWGVKEARDIGVEEVLLDAGAHVTPVWKQYMEGAGDVGDIPMAMMVPDIPGIVEPSSSGRVSGAARCRDRRGCDGRARRARRNARGRKLTDGDVRHERPGDRTAGDARRRRRRARVNRAEASRHHVGSAGADVLHRGPSRRRSRGRSGRPRRRSRARVTCSSWCSTNAVVARACICARACRDNIASRVGPEPSSSSRRATSVATRGVSR